MQLFQTYFQFMPQSIHKNAFIPLLNLIPAWALNTFFRFPAALGQAGKKSFVNFLKNYQNNSLFANYIALKTLWQHDSRYHLYTESFKHHASEQWLPPVRDNQGAFLDRLLKLQWDEWLQDWAILRQDKNAMAHSLEVRLPFLDHDLIDLSFRLSPKLKATWFRDKIIERKIAQNLLPKQITKRPKKPFYFPMNYFFEHPQFNELVKLTLNKHQVLKRGYFEPKAIQDLLKKMQSREFIYLKQICSLVILELWHMIFIDKQMP
jgi:asparagine synthase (glutamine-hydrolysing)